MKKKSKKEEKGNDSEEENDLLNQKNPGKLDITPEEIKVEYERYLNCKLKYPKSQFCFFYFKDECTLGNKCQFCHGYKEFSMERFLNFAKDKTAVETSSQKYYQKYYFNHIIPTELYTYENLLDYQEKHKDKFKTLYTIEELKESREKRYVIRKVLGQEILEQFVIELFNKFNAISLSDLEYYIINVGYPLNFKKFIKNNSICFPKTIKENNKNIAYYIKSFTPEEMMNIFIKRTIEYMKNGKYEDYFPLDYNLINKILFMNTGKFEPTLNIFRNTTKISEKDFINNYIEKLIDECNKGNFDLIKNKTKEDLLGNEVLDCAVFLENNLSKLNIKKLSLFNFSEMFKDKKYDLNEFKFKLYNDGYLFFFNNDNNLIAFNFNCITSTNIEEDFYDNNYYYKNCFKELELINKIENMNLENDKGIIELNSKNIYKIENTIINFIDDENSLNYFKYQSKYFEVLSIDIEGKFEGSYEDIKINLIQICDNTNSKDDIYVIDFYNLKNKSNECFEELSKLLRDIFNNKKIKKIFFDGRSDLLALHKELNICIKNYIDLSSLYNAVNSYMKQNEFKILTKKEKNVKDFMKYLNICRQNYFSKGLNTVLKQYHSKNSFNPLKEKYHKLFEEKDFEYWTKRPIVEEFLLYSALDVKYEFDTYNNLKNKLVDVLKDFYEINDINENKIDVIILLISFPNQNAACNKHFININKIKEK